MEKTLINLRWVFFVVVFAVLIVLGAVTLNDDLWLSVSIIMLGVFFITGYAFLIPNRYTFSVEGIEVRYCFGLKTFLRWELVKHIEDHYAGGKAFPWWREYQIGYFDSKIRFHQVAALPKNKKTTEQIEKYYHKTVEKYG